MTAEVRVRLYSDFTREGRFEARGRSAWIPLAAVTCLADVEALDLRKAQQGLVNALATARRLPRLRTLLLSGTPLVDGGVAALSSLVGLERLYLSRTRVGDLHLAALAGMGRLQNLTLTGNAIQGWGLGPLSRLASLKNLLLNANDIGDEALQVLQPLHRLETLWLDDTCLTSAAGWALQGCTNLRRLHLNRTGIDDRIVSSLVTLRGLRWLHVVGTRISRRGITRLREALPRAEVIHGLG